MTKYVSVPVEADGRIASAIAASIRKYVPGNICSDSGIGRLIWRDAIAALAPKEAPAAICDHGHADPLSLCSDCEAASMEAPADQGEGAGWTWLNGHVECDPADRDYSADEMVDAFMAGQYSRRANPQAAPEPESDPYKFGWIVSNANGDRWRAWEHGFTVWTPVRGKATRYARREDAEAVHAEDDDAWRVTTYSAQPLSNTQELGQGAAARVEAVTKGGKIEDVYGGESWIDPALAFRADLEAILAGPVYPNRQVHQDAQPVGEVAKVIDFAGTPTEVVWSGKMPPAGTKLYTQPSPDALKAAIVDIAAERQRQVDAEGWSSEHDDEYSMGELERAAGWYALNSILRGPETLGVADYDCEANKLFAPKHGCGAYQWPWSIEWWKPSEDPRRDLVKAGALILAAIERLDRQALAALKGGA